MQDIVPLQAVGEAWSVVLWFKLQTCWIKKASTLHVTPKPVSGTTDNNGSILDIFHHWGRRQEWVVTQLSPLLSPLCPFLHKYLLTPPHSAAHLRPRHSPGSSLHVFLSETKSYSNVSINAGSDSQWQWQFPLITYTDEMLQRILMKNIFILYFRYSWTL